MRTVGADDATACLPHLLDQVAKGETITITRHGVPIAMLIPAMDRAFTSPREVITALRAFRQDKTLAGLRVRDLIDDGRRF